MLINSSRTLDHSVLPSKYSPSHFHGLRLCLLFSFTCNHLLLYTSHTQFTCFYHSGCQYRLHISRLFRESYLFSCQFLRLYLTFPALSSQVGLHCFLRRDGRRKHACLRLLSFLSPGK